MALVRQIPINSVIPLLMKVMTAWLRLEIPINSLIPVQNDSTKLIHTSKQTFMKLAQKLLSHGLRKLFYPIQYLFDTSSVFLFTFSAHWPKWALNHIKLKFYVARSVLLLLFFFSQYLKHVLLAFPTTHLGIELL